MVEIPEILIKRLQGLGPHFIRVARRGKKAIDKGWTQNPMFADDPKLQDWLRKGGNYGVVGGWGLVIVDVDHPELKRIAREKLPRTFTVQSPGSKGLHLYYLCSLEKPIRLRDKDGENVGDIQGQGKMVVGPGSIHPNGGVYRIIDESPLAQVTCEQLKEVFKDYIVPEKEIERIEATARMEKRETNIDIDILDVVPLAGLKKQGDEYYGPHPIHGSTTGRNFWVNPKKNCWHCFRHESGGGPLLWLAVEEGIIDCAEAGPGALRGEIFKEVLEKARERGLIEEIKKTSQRESRIEELKKEVQDALVEDEYILRAKNLFEINPYFYDSLTGFFYVYDWNEGIYVQKDDDEVLAFFFDFLDPDLKRSITSSVRKNRLLQAFKIIGLKNHPKNPPKTWIKVKNGIVDIETGELREPTSEYFFVNAIPWKLGESEETPTIDKLFSSWVGEEKRRLLYEITAYPLYPNYPIHRIFILFGSGRNGKGSFLRLLIKFLGKRNCVSTDIERLENSRFETSRLFQKLLAIIAETDYATMEKSATLKALCGQDLIPGEYKFKNRFEFENYAKLIIATNNLPQSLDTSDGFFSRMIVIDFPNVFDAGKDIIAEIPEKEFENLLRKCIRILRDLLKRGRFTDEGTIEEKRERYEERSNPLKTFIEEKCEFDPEGFIPSTEFYNRFKAWMIKNRPRFRIPSWRNEVKPLLESMGLETGIQKRVGDERPRCIIGLKWKRNVSDVSSGSGLLINVLGDLYKNKIPETSETSETPIVASDFVLSEVVGCKRLDLTEHGECSYCKRSPVELTHVVRTFERLGLLVCEDCARQIKAYLRERMDDDS